MTVGCKLPCHFPGDEYFSYSTVTNQIIQTVNTYQLDTNECVLFGRHIIAIFCMYIVFSILCHQESCGSERDSTDQHKECKAFQHVKCFPICSTWQNINKT